MSVTAMAAVLSADFPKYIDWHKDGAPRRSKGSTVKLVLICYADKANDEGEGAYPGYERLLIETDLSGQGLADTIECLRQNDFLYFEGRSQWNTKSYKVNIPKLHDMKHELFLKPLEKRFSSHLSRVSQATRVNPSVKQSVKEEEEEKIDFSQVYTFFQNNIGPGKTYDHELLGDMCDEHTPHWVLEALKISVKRNARNLSYTDAILKRWAVDGYGSERKNGKGKSNGKSNNQPDLDDGFMEELKAKKRRLEQQV